MENVEENEEKWKMEGGGKMGNNEKVNEENKKYKGKMTEKS